MQQRQASLARAVPPSCARFLLICKVPECRPSDGSPFLRYSFGRHRQSRAPCGCSNGGSSIANRKSTTLAPNDWCRVILIGALRVKSFPSRSDRQLPSNHQTSHVLLVASRYDPKHVVSEWPFQVECFPYRGFSPNGWFLTVRQKDWHFFVS